MYPLACSCPLVIKVLEKIFKAFLWTGIDVQQPMHLGGLGVLDLQLMGIAMRVRWL